MTEKREDRLAGTLLGTALGDALGLATEGMKARAIARRFGRVERFHLLGRKGFVSDDTEQSALVAQSLIRAPDDVARFVALFRWSLLGWFARLPFGIGLATLRACFKIALGLERSGVRSAGNGAAMRAAVVGVFHEGPAERLAFGTALARVTHTDPRAVEGALFTAELAAACARSSPDASRLALFDEARPIAREPELAAALDAARALAAGGAATGDAAARLGTSGFVVHTVPFAAFAFLRHGADPLATLSEIVGSGGDTDSIAAIAGAWLGALHGVAGLPAALVADLSDGPFGPTHLRALAAGLAGSSRVAPRYSVVRALLGNLALYPVVIAHVLRRLVPL
jgi:ADP-ribosylglycohydrolase